MAHFVAEDFVVSMGMHAPCRSFRSLVVLSEYECIPESAMALRAVLQTWSVFKFAHKELLSVSEAAAKCLQSAIRTAEVQLEKGAGEPPRKKLKAAPDGKVVGVVSTASMAQEFNDFLAAEKVRKSALLGKGQAILDAIGEASLEAILENASVQEMQEMRPILLGLNFLKVFEVMALLNAPAEDKDTAVGSAPVPETPTTAIDEVSVTNEHLVNPGLIQKR